MTKHTAYTRTELIDLRKISVIVSIPPDSVAKGRAQPCSLLDPTLEERALLQVWTI
jgi:hypothetical protein